MSIVDETYREKLKTKDWLAQLIEDSCSDTVVVEKDGKKVKTKVFNYNTFIKMGALNGIDVANYKKLLKAPENGAKGRLRMGLRNQLQKVAKGGKVVVPNGKGGSKKVTTPSDWLDADGKPVRDAA